ncbi:Sodium:sulfate symporter transmembrane region-domain-containing protein [Dissophora ornata]|nr:Sodium:sulfate symporter transmembrane region-domain-containing protein [Dissophora ornata]
MNIITTSYSTLCSVLDETRAKYSNLATSEDDIEAGLQSSSGDLNESTNLLSSRTDKCAETHVGSTHLPGADQELDIFVQFYSKKEQELCERVEALLSDIHYVEYLGDTRISTEASGMKGAGSRRSSGANGRPTPARSGSWSFDVALALADESLFHNTIKYTRDEEQSARVVASGSGHRIESISESTAVNVDMPRDRVDRDEGGYTKRAWFESESEEVITRFRHNCIEAFIDMSKLQAYVMLKSVGFPTTLKKYGSMSDGDKQTVLQAYPFRQETKARLQEQLGQVQGIYARTFADYHNAEAANLSLQAYLKARMELERSTAARGIIDHERKSQSVPVDTSPNTEQESIFFKTPMGAIHIPTFLTRDVIAMALCCIVFVLLLSVDVFREPEQQNCFAILVFASLLWATEAIPLFVTSLLVPLLVVMLRVMTTDDKDHVRLEAQDAAKRIFSLMFSPVIMLLLGGFSIAAAMSKFDIAKAMATVVLSRAGTRPSAVLLANMFVATVASVWISNVAAPVLCFSLIQPILRTLPAGSPFAKCLILGIALASNVGGMASPISSPQNIIAIEYMNPAPSWLEWFLVALPVCLICDLLIWILLLWVYQPSSSTPALSTMQPTNDPITKTQIFVCGVTIITIFLWCFERRLQWLFGEMGMIAIIPLLAFFGTGILTKEDFNNFLWTVIFLAMGGIALGKAVESSGLLHTIAMQVQGYVKGMSTFEVCCVFVSLVLVAATFISHTVGALIILPIVAQVGATLPDPHPRLMVMTAALMCSGAMGLPVSGFPNMNAIMMEDEEGRRYLSTKDFLKVGIPSSVAACVAVLTLGYALMSTLGW